MKTLFVIAVLVGLTSCETSRRPPSNPRFKAGERVGFNGFYSLCTGLVQKYFLYSTSVNYRVQLDCPGIDYFSGDFRENDLIKI